MAKFYVIDEAETTVGVKVTGLSAGDIVAVYIQVVTSADDPPYAIAKVGYYTADSSTLEISDLVNTPNDYDGPLDGVYAFDQLQPNVSYYMNVEINGGDLLGKEKFSTIGEEVWPDPFITGYSLYDDMTISFGAYYLLEDDVIQVRVRESETYSVVFDDYYTVLEDSEYIGVDKTNNYSSIGPFEPSTWYILYVRVNGGDWLFEEEFLTPSIAEDLSVEIDETTSTTMTVTLTGTVDGGITAVSIKTLLGVEIAQKSTFMDTTFIFTDLTPSTTYYIVVTVSDFYGNTEEAYSGTFTTNSSSRPENWSWYKTIDVGEPILLSAKEWNDFMDRINDFREYCGISKNYTFTTAISKETYISADIVNEARNAIYEIPYHNSSKLPLEVDRYSEITASFFIGLQDALNAVPYID